MAWAAVLKTFAKGSVKKIAAKKFLGRDRKKGRRQNVKNIMQQQGEYDGGGALAVRPTTSLAPTFVSDSALSISKSSSSKSGGLEGALVRISVKTIAIDKFLRTKKESEKQQDESKRKQDENRRRQSEEAKLEKKKKTEPLGFRTPLPKLTFLDRLKKFITNILLGWITLKLIDWLPKLQGTFLVLGAAGDNFLKIGGWLFNAMATVVKIGYDAFTAVENQVKNVFGDKGLKIFHRFTDVFKLFLTTSLIAAMVAAKAGLLGLNPMQLLKSQKAAALGGKLMAGAKALGGKAMALGGKAVSAVFSVPTAVVSGVGLLASAIGEGAFQLNKWGEDREHDALTKFQEFKWWKNPFKKAGWGAGWLIMKFLNATFAPIRLLLDIIGTPFRYLIELIRYPFLDEAGKAKQLENLAKFDSRIREGFRKIFSALTFGVIGGGEAGSWGNIFSHEDAQTKMEEDVYNRNLEKKSNESENEKKRLGGWISRDSTYDLHAGEIVVDGNSAVYAKDMLLAINAASTREGVIKAIKDYAPYEVGGSQPAIALPVSVTTPFMPEQNNRSVSMSDSSGGPSLNIA